MLKNRYSRIRKLRLQLCITDNIAPQPFRYPLFNVTPYRCVFPYISYNMWIFNQSAYANEERGVFSLRAARQNTTGKLRTGN